jgi:hypothetical protein
MCIQLALTFICSDTNLMEYLKLTQKELLTARTKKCWATEKTMEG